MFAEAMGQIGSYKKGPWVIIALEDKTMAGETKGTGRTFSHR
jgi:hypothetical protein